MDYNYLNDLSRLVSLTHGAVAAGRAEVADAHGNFAHPVGATENRLCRTRQGSAGTRQFRASRNNKKRLGLGAFGSEGRAAWRLSADAWVAM